jgi:glycosyltransferase involved in cell wall biosynthesis
VVEESTEMPETIPALSLVILCYRSEEFAKEFTARTLKMMRSHEIEDFELILVGNYIEDTGDRTPEIVRELATTDPRICCQAEPKRGMMGWDLRSGLARATGAYIGFIDGDGQMPIDDVGKLYELIEGSEFDLVKSYRVTRADGWNRKILTTGYNLLFRVLFPGLKARDMNAKPKIIRRAAYEKMRLTSDGWFIDAEIMIEALHHKMRIGEIPTEFRRLDRRGSFVNLGAVFEFMSQLARRRVTEFFR